MEVIIVIFDLYGDGEYVPAVHLRPAGDTGDKHMDALFCSQLYQVILVVQRRPRTDKAHVAFQDAPQLRELIEAEPSQKWSNGCKVFVRIF